MQEIWQLIDRYTVGEVDAPEFARLFDKEFRKCCKIHALLSHHFHGVINEVELQGRLSDMVEAYSFPLRCTGSIQAFQYYDGQVIDVLVREAA